MARRVAFPAREYPEEEMAQDMPTARKPTLLIAGAGDPTLDALEALLTTAGSIVLRARGGAEALGMLAGRPVDTILCETHLADMDGVQLLAQAARAPDRMCRGC
ncbi:MAG: hypothetical protein MZV65_34730 [Chromatiales bacterium]|nr:hypothetical protein [Chromatiales bacterium]